MARRGKPPDIKTYAWQKRKDYLLMIAAVAAADGKLPKEELELLHSWMDAFNLGKKSREEVLATARRKKPNLEPVQRRLAKSDLTYSLILDMMGMAMVDGVLQEKEIVLLGEVAGHLGVNPIDFSILIEFVHSAHQASKLSNPEPLYEHNIESAFQLLEERKIRLFPHTLLCSTSPEFDAKLKSRWFSRK